VLLTFGRHGDDAPDALFGIPPSNECINNSRGFEPQRVATRASIQPVKLHICCSLNRLSQTGPSAAFVTTPDDPDIDPFLIDYVSTFVPKSSGDNFNPHVTTGVAAELWANGRFTAIEGPLPGRSTGR